MATLPNQQSIFKLLAYVKMCGSRKYPTSPTEVWVFWGLHHESVVIIGLPLPKKNLTVTLLQLAYIFSALMPQS